MENPERPLCDIRRRVEECDSIWAAYEAGYGDGYAQACKDVKTEQLELELND